VVRPTPEVPRNAARESGARVGRESACWRRRREVSARARCSGRAARPDHWASVCRRLSAGSDRPERRRRPVRPNVVEGAARRRGSGRSRETEEGGVAGSSETTLSVGLGAGASGASTMATTSRPGLPRKRKSPLCWIGRTGITRAAGPSFADQRDRVFRGTNRELVGTGGRRCG